MIKLDKKGFSLVEALLVMGVSTAGAIGTIQYNQDKSNKLENTNMVLDISNIINAIDQRITIDGYNVSSWSKTSWSNESEIVSDLLLKELIASGSSCSGGNWIPSLSTMNTKNLVDCNLWQQRRGLDLDMSAAFKLDSVGFIQDFDFFLSFNNVEDFNDNFLDYKYALTKSLEKNKKEVSGIHSYELVEKGNSLNKLTSQQCVARTTDCSFKVSFNRSGGAEYMRSDGDNSLINDHLTFIETKDSAPINCLRWKNTKRDGTGVWEEELIEECGVGIYRNASNPVMVDVLADTGTFKNITLDKSCIVYEWNGSNVVDSSSTSPCGITNSGTEIIQVVENTIAKTATVKDIYLEKGFINIAETDLLSVRVSDINEIITTEINTEIALISNELNVDGVSILKNSDINGLSDFNSQVSFNSIADFNSLSTFKSDLSINQSTTIKDVNVKNNLFAKNNLNTKNLIANDLVGKKDLTIKNDLNSKNDSGFVKDVFVKNSLSSNKIETDRITTSNVNATTTMYDTASSTLKMESPIGNFNNINSQISDLYRKMNSSKSATNSIYNCNTKKTIVTASNGRCRSGYDGYVTTYYYADYYWSGNKCSKRVTSSKVNTCYKKKIERPSQCGRRCEG